MNYIFSKTDLRKLILPLVFEQALAITVGMADTMMVASLGEAAVSGVSLVDMVNMLIFTVLASLATGGAVITSQFIGAKNLQSALKSAKQLMYAAVFFGVIIAIVVVIVREPLLDLFFGRIEEAVMDNAILYLWISAISFPFLAVYNACAALYRSMGRSQVTFNVSVLINLINVAGNALCIFVLHMGVAGVAIPSAISRIVGAIILLILLQNKKLPVHLDMHLDPLDMKLIKRILYIGIPSGIEGGIFQLGRVLVVSIISMFGTVQIAANGVANNLDAVGCIIGQAMNLAMITVIGQCVGARDEGQIKYYLKKLIKYAYIGTACINIPVLIFLNPILGLYGLSPETTQLSYILVMIHDSICMFMWPIAFVFPNMLRACNDVRFPMVASIASMFIFRIGFSYILGVYMGMGAIGVWIAMIIDWICRIICFVLRYRSGKWKKRCYLE